ncbi:AI-2E family transporter [Cupriavidus necator]|uniref:AI-2E family transporter n=1 Tax=Cupriavidus necator TaxID=106590 RepID=UPI0018928AF3|nr:AI-2E family transporter [Cupriavidus necator]
MPGPAEPRPARQVAHLKVSESPSLHGLVSLAIGVTVVAGLYVGRDVLIPITLAVFLSVLVRPLVSFLCRIKLGRIVSVLVAVTISVSVLVLLSGVIVAQITALAVDMPRYQATIEQKINTVHRLTIGKLSSMAGTAGRAFQQATVDLPQVAREPRAAASQAQPPAALPVEVIEPAPSAFHLARQVLSPVVRPLETAFIVFIVTIFILLQRDDLRDRAIRLFGSGDLHRTTTAMDDAARRLSRYFLAQFAVNAGVGVAIGSGLFLIGIPSPVLWGMLAALLRLVPYVGIWIVAVLATALAAAVSPEWSMAIWSLALFVIVELLAGQVIEPMLYGHSTGISPFSVVVAAIFWSWLWGPVGLILSTPLTLCLVVLGRHVGGLEILDVLLGDQSTLTPVENFYQRALAGDPDEILEQAEVLLRDRSLSSYYDEVAIKGLQLAASDVLRGVVTAAQLARIETTVNDLVEGLESFADIEPNPGGPDDHAATLAPYIAEQDSHQPGPWPPLPGIETLPARSADGHVLCIAGRGPLDELASTILVQLLGKHDLDCRVVPHDAASRTRMQGLDVPVPTIVCIFYLNIEGIPSHLRYLVRRVQQRFPDASIVVGLWPRGDTDQWSERLQSAIGANHYATSVRSMVDACLATIRTENAIDPEPLPGNVGT